MAAARPYTGRVRVWVAVYVFLLPAAFARGGMRVEAPPVTQFGGWEVEVTVDEETCEISCDYRLRRDRFGRKPVTDLLLPPAIDIRVYTDSASLPTTVTIDPAHTREPVLRSDGLATSEEALLPGARVDMSPPPDASLERKERDLVGRAARAPAVARVACTPLRG